MTTIMRGTTIRKLRLSYSKLVLFETCPLAYYLSYVARSGREFITNVYAQYGSFAHQLIDRWARGELKSAELIGQYRDGYAGAVTLKFPASSPDAADEYYAAGYDYFADFQSVHPGARIVESETKHVQELFGFDFSFVIDLVLELPDGTLALMDHKSASRRNFYGKQGRDRFRQLYLYAELYQRKSGRYPDKLIFNLFRGGVQIERGFDPAELKHTLDWAEETANDIRGMIERFRNDPTEWAKQPQNRWYCHHLCDVSESCA